MSYLRPRPGTPTRSVTDISSGDYIKLGSSWHEVASNSEAGNGRIAARDGNWTITTVDGQTVSGWGVDAYAKREDLEVIA